jgi:iron-sulfur cluster repair protein YtfE (RIC family)
VKRHPALIPLSHDHRQGLFLAQVVRPGPPRYQGVPSTPSTRRTYALKLADALLLPHMHAEETLLAPLVAGRDAEIDDLLARLQAEHRTLQQQIEALHHASTVELEAALHTFGQTLEGHIRTEERQLFQRIQAIADESLLAHLGERFAAYRRTVCLTSLTPE